MARTNGPFRIDLTSLPKRKREDLKRNWNRPITHYTLTLTWRQADLIKSVLMAAPEQNSKFLFHDDWDAQLSGKQRAESLRTQRAMIRAYDTFTRKLNPVRKGRP